MTVIIKNICNITSIQKMTDEFLDGECVENLCRILDVEPHEFLPHYVTLNEFLSRPETGELECLRKNMVRTLLRRRKFEGARFLGKYWLLVFDATTLFHFLERLCPHCLKKVINKGIPKEKEMNPYDCHCNHRGSLFSRFLQYYSFLCHSISLYHQIRIPH